MVFMLCKRNKNVNRFLVGSLEPDLMGLERPKWQTFLLISLEIKEKSKTLIFARKMNLLSSESYGRKIAYFASSSSPSLPLLILHFLLPKKAHLSCYAATIFVVIVLRNTKRLVKNFKLKMMCTMAGKEQPSTTIRFICIHMGLFTACNCYI